MAEIALIALITQQNCALLSHAMLGHRATPSELREIQFEQRRKEPNIAEAELQEVCTVALSQLKTTIEQKDSMALPRVFAHLADTMKNDIQLLVDSRTTRPDSFTEEDQSPDDRPADNLPGPEHIRHRWSNHGFVQYRWTSHLGGFNFRRQCLVRT
jgi:hypothetical protein